MTKIIRPDNLEWPEDFDILKIGMSQSLWYTWMTCKRMFLFTINGYRNPAKVFNTNFGSMVHEVNDKVYSTNKLPTKKQVIGHIDDFITSELKKKTMMSQQQLELDAAKAEATLVPYFEFYEKDFKTKKFFDVEHTFKQLYSGFTMKGKIDAKFRVKNKKKWLNEHKTKGQIQEQTLIDYLPLDFQNLYYLLADEIETGEPAEGVLYNVIRNSGIKLLKNQSIKSYKEKITNAISMDPEHHFKRWEIVYPKQDRKEFGQHVSGMAEEIKLKQDLKVFPNRWACMNPWPCPFLKACSGNSCTSLTQIEGSTEERLFPELKEDKTNDNKKIKQKSKEKKVAKRIAKRIKR